MQGSGDMASHQQGKTSDRTATKGLYLLTELQEVSELRTDKFFIRQADSIYSYTAIVI